ncbi:MAG: hypothetical protein K8953_07800, partial [Proteobacteria bacterium]|nr:hypothetical protein [Pseudomonadota bacterium]
NAGNPACPTPEPTVTEVTTPQVTAKVWADSFHLPLARAASVDDTRDKFLIGRATDLDDGGVSPSSYTEPGYNKGLNLADATFNGVSLGGDRADGVAFFAAARTRTVWKRDYAGILSGTNLGAPLTDTQGSAKWIGTFRASGWEAVDFILNISFGTGDGAGEIEALARTYRDYHLKGEFDDAGVITGIARQGRYRTNDPAISGVTTTTGVITGLIGEEGAVGAFITGNGSAGFVARPPSAAELQTVEQTCADNPFDDLCSIGYESERGAIIERCIIGGNANDESCKSAIGLYYCIKRPFESYCGHYLPSYSEQLRANRVEFCRTEGNADNELCTADTTFAHICTNYPFTTQCLGDSDYDSARRTACFGDPFAPRCAGDVYDNVRVRFCAANAGNHPSCPAPDGAITETTITEVATPQVTASVWVNSFEQPLSHGATASDGINKFLIGKETDLDTGGLITRSAQTINLADATFNGVALGGDRADGAAFFQIERDSNNNNLYYNYAGVLSGTNLGAPLTDTNGSAKWIGSFKIGDMSATDFVLNISFGTGAGAGEIEAIVQKYNYFDYHIEGKFNGAGVIAGTARGGTFRTPDPNNRGESLWTGKLTGLIGEEGAVGAVLFSNYFAGFVARPSSTAELQNVEQTCTDDPFNKLCSIGYESERAAVIEHCIIGGNANDESCRSANQLHICIKRPFQSVCSKYLPQHYQQARDNRVEFCRTAENADNGICTVPATYNHVCYNYPFTALCRDDNDYRPIRRNACTDNPFAPRCAGDAYNDLRVTFCENNAGNPACPQPTPQVTAEVWADSFDTPLSHAASLDHTDDQFLIGRATDLDTGDVGVSRYNPLMSLNLADATFNGVALGGDRADGVAFF